MSEPRERRSVYTCLVGHAIPPDQLEILTELCVLDCGATVRQCREHGTPIALTSFPQNAEETHPAGDLDGSVDSANR